MATTRELRRRIKSVKNTSQITRAMEMVAASKMKRAQVTALASRPYSEKIEQVLAHLAGVTAKTGCIVSELHPLLEKRSVNNVGIILITPDRGLSGGLNTAIIQKAASFILDLEVPSKIIAVGRKGRDWMNRRGVPIVAEFTQLGDRPEFIDTLKVSHAVIDSYLEHIFDEVFLVYPHFVSTMLQRPVIHQLLPVVPEECKPSDVDYLYEPSPEVVLSELLPRFVEMEVYHAILESIASEQSARMVAMRNATENAYELIDDLTLKYNRVRQATITKEIAEIAAAEAVLK